MSKTKSYLAIYWDTKKDDLILIEFAYEEDANQFIESTLDKVYLVVVDDGHWTVRDYT